VIEGTTARRLKSFSDMTRRVTTRLVSMALWSLTTLTVIVELMLATVSNADEDSATAADMDWGCAAAAAEYQHFGDIKGVPTKLIEGDFYSTASETVAKSLLVFIERYLVRSTIVITFPSVCLSVCL